MGAYRDSVLSGTRTRYRVVLYSLDGKECIPCSEFATQEEAEECVDEITRKSLLHFHKIGISRVEEYPVFVPFNEED